MREKEEPSAIWREEKEPVRPNTYLQKNKENSTKKPAEMEQQLKQQLMQKKFMQISRKKKESTVFSILPFAKNSTNYKKQTPSYTIISKSRIHNSKW